MPDPAIGRAVITVGADATPFNREIGQKTAAAGPGIGTKMASVMGGALSVGGKVAGAGIAAVLGGAIFKGFSRLTDIDNAKGKLAGLGHSAKSVENIMKSALKSVQGTSFGLGEAAGSAANLVAAGVKPGKDLTRVLTLMADTATIAGTDMAEVGYQFQKVAASGKLTGESIASLTDRGIPVLQFLSKSLGVSTEKARQMASDGKISFKQFQDAMQGGLGGAAQAGGKTFTGAMKNVGAALGRVGASLLGGIFAQLPNLMAKLIGFFDKISPAAKAVGAALGGAFAAGFKALSDFLTNPAVKAAFTEIVGGVQALAAAFKDGGDDITSSGFAGTMERIGLQARRVFDWIANIGIPAFKQFAKNVAIPALINLGNFIKDTLVPVLVDLGGKVYAVIAFFVEHQNAAKALGIVVGAAVATMIVAWTSLKIVAMVTAVQVKIAAMKASAAAAKSAVIQVASWAATGAKMAWAAAQAVAYGVKTAAVWLAQKVLALSSMAVTVAGVVAGWVAIAAAAVVNAVIIAAQWLIAFWPIALIIAAVVGLAIIIWKNFDKIKKWIGGAWDWIKEKTAAVWNAITGWLSGVWASITGAVSTAWAAITGAISTAWNAVINWLKTTGAQILNVITMPWRIAIALVIGVVMMLYNWIVPKITAMVTWLTTTFTMLWTNVVGIFTKVKDFIVGVWNTVVAWVTAKITALYLSVMAIFSAIRNFIVGVWNTIVAWVVPKVMWLVNRVVTGFTNIWNRAVAIFTAIKDFLVGIWNTVYAYVAGVMLKIWTAIQSAFARVKSIVTTVLTTVRDFISGVWTAIKDKISSVVSTLAGIVSTAFNNVKKAISDKIAAIRATAADLINKVKKAISDKVSDIIQSGKDIVMGLINGIIGMGKTLWNKITKFITDNVPGPVRKLLGLKSPSKLFKRFGQNIGQGLIEGILSQGTGVKEATSSLAKTVSASFGTPVLGAAAVMPATVKRSALLANRGTALSPLGGSGAGRALAADDFRVILEKVLAAAKPNNTFEQVFNEKVNPDLLSKEIAWALR